MADLNGKLGANASTYGWYAQVSSSSWSGSQLLEVKDDVVASGAVFQPAVMPTGGFSQITSDVALQIATVLQEFTDAGVEVWLRFGHEMNYYVTTGTYSGTADEFVSAWKVVHDAVSSNSKIAMFWSPNNVGENQDASGLDPWFPGPDYVDVVGIDCYPSSSSSTFDGCYSSFYKEFSAAYNKPFAIGETGAGDFKESWLKQLVSQDASTYPNYVAASWFEYDKEADFRIVETDDTTLSETKATLLSGSGTGSGGSSSTTTSSAPASTSTSACTWG
ncbi:MAG: hypothetical protein M1818_007080 [Claussenomyces sp. TS43310]|nr:MAG: hypothetical protein M1818_007080 [Claussenomyces sp. TS43310]